MSAVHWGDDEATTTACPGYVCWSCQRHVDPDLEPSPGEPDVCADCSLRRDKEEAR